MDFNDFQTIGECAIGYAWKVSSENKIVVNIGKVALYFEIDEFFVFAHMIEQSVKNLSKETKETSKEAIVETEMKSKISNITKFRSPKSEDDSDN